MSASGQSVLRVLDDVERIPECSLETVWEAYRRERDAGAAPFVAAASVATRVDRLGFVMAVGYPAALEHLIEGVGVQSALCVTEEKGNSPRAIESTLEQTPNGYTLRGVKSFVTFGSFAETLIVIARVGIKPDGRPDLAVVRIPASRRGVVLEALAETPFIPEVPHNRVRFEDVEVLSSERLPGDGYLNYVKPFRTVEDIHVMGATLAYLIGWARRTAAPVNVWSELTVDLVALDGLRQEPPLDPRVHIALHGVIERVTSFVESEAFAKLLSAAPKDEAEHWRRDQVLLRIASKAREARLERALHGHR